MPCKETALIGDTIKELRQVRGLKVSELARRGRISKAYLSQLENGHAMHPSAEVVVRLCRVLGCTLEEMLGAPGPSAIMSYEVPASLRLLAHQDSLKPDEIAMLSRISYNGRQPTSIEGWRVILDTIRQSISEDRS